jgi:hypothetical protein
MGKKLPNAEKLKHADKRKRSLAQPQQQQQHHHHHLPKRCVNV